MHTDALGHTFEFSAPPKRVVSLVPSLTEVLFDLGAGASVAGVTSFCIHPPQARETAAVVGGTKNPKVDVIRQLAPDLVYMNLEENLKRHAEAIREFAPVFVTEPKKVADVESLILQLARIHAREREGDAIVSRLAAALEEVRRKARRFTFAVAIWKNPWMWCGGDTYVSNLVAEAGGLNVFAGQTRYPTLQAEDVVREHRPEVIFLPDEPYLFTDDDAADLRAKTGARVVGPFAGDLFTWHGTRTVEGLAFLRDFLDT